MKLNDTKQKINDLKWQIEQIDEKDIQYERYSRKSICYGMARDIVDAIAADRVEALNKQKRTLQIDYNTNLNQYDSLYKAWRYFGI